MPLTRFVAWLTNLLRPPAADPVVPPAPGFARRPKQSAPTDSARELVLAGQAPEDFSTGRLDLSGVTDAFTLPPRLQCFELLLANSSVEILPPGIRVEHRLDLTGCKRLLALPEGLRTGTLILRDCTALTALPARLEVHFLDLTGCHALASWPESARVSLGRVSARNCRALRGVPTSLGPISSLDLSGCELVETLPENVTVTSWVDLHATRIRRLPDSMRGVRLRWKGVLVPEKVIFAPETMTAAEILAEPNAEVRRVMLDRFGLERFLAGCNSTVRDEDQDPGGQRQLIAVDLPGDEALVCVIILCPSTGRRYMVRVPPATQTCHEAIAWTAGFDNPADYAPVQET